MKGVLGWKSLNFETYQDYINSDLWQSKKQLMLEKFQKCQKCGSNKNLVVHHITYLNVGDEKLKDLIVLCWDCHQKEHKK